MDYDSAMFFFDNYPGHIYFQTAFLQGLLGRNIKYCATLSKDHMSRFSNNMVTVYGQDKYLLVSVIRVFPLIYL